MNEMKHSSITAGYKLKVIVQCWRKKKDALLNTNKSRNEF
jgi:hypothetical protein